MRRVVMTEERDIRETGDVSKHYEPGDIEVFGERIVTLLVQQNACRVLGKVPDDYDANRTTREPGRPKQATQDNKAAPPEENKGVGPKTTKKKRGTRR